MDGGADRSSCVTIPVDGFSQVYGICNASIILSVVPRLLEW
jgi:hypothetical protein